MSTQTAQRQQTVQQTVSGTGVPPQRGVTHIVFDNHHETYTGTDRRRRQWRITPSLTGWQLEFRDPGDARPTYAGTHPTLRDAKREAAR